MPMILYRCQPCSRTFEELVKHPVPEHEPCVQCAKPAEQFVAGIRIAKTPGRWGDQTGKYGVNGHYDAGLGATYYSSMERDRIMKAKGLENLSDLGTHYWEDETDRRTQKAAKEAKVAEAYLEATAKYPDDPGKAFEIAMPAAKCDAGDYDDIFTGSN